MLDQIVLSFLKLGVVCFFVFLNGFFVAAEFAIVKIRTTQLDTLIQQGDRQARMARHVVEHLDAYLSATQLGITLASLALGWLGEPFVAKLIHPLFMKLGLPVAGHWNLWRVTVSGENIVHSVSIAIAFSIITFLHIVFGELAPKSLAIQKAKGVALTVAAPLHWFFVVFRPVIFILNGTANWMLRLAGIRPARESELAHSEEEIRLILGESTRNRQVSAIGQSLVTKALDLRRRIVRDVMIPRTQVTVLYADKTLAENMDIARHAKHSRYPLVSGSLDHVEGLVLFKDLFLLADERGAGADIRTIRRDIDFVPEMMPLEKLLGRFRHKKAHLAIVVDEFGGAVGVVTLENVLEELVGEIQDELDQETPSLNQVSPDEFVIEGIMPLHEFREKIHCPLEDHDVSTVGGYITAQIGHIPRPGEQTRIGTYLCTVQQTDGRSIRKAHFKRVPGALPTRSHPAVGAISENGKAVSSSESGQEPLRLCGGNKAHPCEGALQDGPGS